MKSFIQIENILLSIIFIFPFLLGGNRFWAIYPFAIFILITSINNSAVFVSLDHIVKKNKNACMIFVFFYLLSVSFSLNLANSMYQSIIWIAFLLFTLNISLLDKKQLEKILMCSILSSALHVLITICMMMNWLPNPGWNPHLFPAGLFKNHNHLGASLGITILWNIVFIIKDSHGYPRSKMFIALILQLVGLIVTESRGAWIAIFFAVSSGLILFNKKFTLSLIEKKW